MKKKIIIIIIVISLLLVTGILLFKKQLPPEVILKNKWIYVEDNNYIGTFSLNRDYEYYFHEDGSPIFGSDLCPTYNYKSNTVYLNCGFLKRDKIEIISYNEKELVIKLDGKEIKLITEKSFDELQEKELNKYNDSKIYSDVMNNKFYRVVNKKYEYLEIENFNKLLFYYNSENEDIIDMNPSFTFDINTNVLTVDNVKLELLSYENDTLKVKLNNELMEFRSYDADYNYDIKYKKNKTYNEIKELYWHYNQDGKNLQISLGNDGSFYVTDKDKLEGLDKYYYCKHYRFDSENEITVLCEDKNDIKLKIHSVSDGTLKFNFDGKEIIAKDID
jgi:hypothetical protein